MMPVLPLLLEAATAPQSDGLAAGLSLWRIFGAWLLCIGIAVALILLLRRLRAGRLPRSSAQLLPRIFAQSSRTIDIVETRRINMAVDLCTFDYSGERYLIAAGPGGTTLLDRSPLPPAPAEGEE